MNELSQNIWPQRKRETQSGLHKHKLKAPFLLPSGTQTMMSSGHASKAMGSRYPREQAQDILLSVPALPPVTKSCHVSDAAGAVETAREAGATLSGLTGEE